MDQFNSEKKNSKELLPSLPNVRSGAQIVPVVVDQETIEDEDLQEQYIFRKLLLKVHPCLLKKSPVCRHQNGCFENATRRALKTFVLSFGSIVMLNILMLSTKPAKLLKAV